MNAGVGAQQGTPLTLDLAMTVVPFRAARSDGPLPLERRSSQRIGPGDVDTALGLPKFTGCSP
jgi:hypothetical protein